MGARPKETSSQENRSLTPHQTTRGASVASDPIAEPLQTRLLQLRLGVRNAIPTSHCQKSFGEPDSITDRLPAKVTLRFTSKRWNGCRNSIISYEVIRVRRREGFEIAGRFVGASEVFPSSKLGRDWLHVDEQRSGVCESANLHEVRREVGR